MTECQSCGEPSELMIDPPAFTEAVKSCVPCLSNAVQTEYGVDPTA